MSKFLVCLVLAVLLSALVASASFLALDGGTMQTFRLQTAIDAPSAVDETRENLVEAEGHPAVASGDDHTSNTGASTTESDGASGD